MTASHPSALETAVRAGDRTALTDWLTALPLAERQRMASAARALYKQVADERWRGGQHEDGPVTSFSPTELATQRLRCASLALALCGTANDVVQAWIDADELIALAARCALPCLDGLGAAYLARSPTQIANVQDLLVAGLIPRPSGDDYTVGLIALPRTLHHDRTLAQYLEADPGLMPQLLSLFDVEGTGEHNLAAVDKFAMAPELEWSQIFLRLAEQGHFSRDQLLGRTLDTLERDWPQFRAGWFSRFHDLLAPSADEMAPHAARYLGLTQSRIPPTVTLALAALKNLHAAGHIDGAALLDALPPVFFSRVKAQVNAALQLADAAVKRSPALAPHAAAVALDGLQHEAADVQKKILDRLAPWGLDDAGRARLAEHLDSLASVHRAAAAALVGVDAAPAPAPAAAQATATPATRGTGPLDPFDPSRALVPITDDASLVERAAFVLENPAETDELERVLDALVRRAPFDDALRAQCGPLAKRARKLQDKVVAGPLARLLLRLLGAIEPEPDWLKHNPDEKRLYQRCVALGDQATKGWRLSPLSAATHQGGFVDPFVLKSRLADLAARDAKANAAEQALADARAQRPLDAPQSRAVVRWEVQSRTSTYADQNFTHHDLVMTPEQPLAQFEGAEVNYRASQSPAALEDFFAIGCHAIGRNLDWWEVAWSNRHYLLPLLWPVTPIHAHGPMAVLLLALALAAKEPGQAATAVDVLVRAQREGRLDGVALGNTLRTLIATPLVKAKRYASSLQAAVRADAQAAPLVFDLLCAMATANVDSPPKDLAALLELLLELALSQQRALPDATRTALAAMKLTGKGREPQRQLLALVPATA